MARKVLGSALEAVTVAAGVARHVAWYLSYQVDGNAREDQPAQKPRRRS